MPLGLTTAEWTQVVSTVAAALAALAALGAVLISYSQQRRSLRPNVTGGISRDPAGNLFANVANAGPGMAYRLAYAVLLEGHRLQAGSIGVGGKLGVDEEHSQNLRLVSGRDDPVYLVWTCNDVHNNVYIWSSDWKSKRFSRRRWLKRSDHTMTASFRLMYPHVALPAQ